MAKARKISKKTALPAEGDAAKKTYRLSGESRKSSQEFSAGSRASALIRKAFAPLIFANASAKLHQHLSEQLRKVIRSGPVALKGMRTLADGDLGLLQGFQFNSYTQLHTVANFQVAATLTPAGLATTSLPAFEPAQTFRKAPNSNLAIVRIMAACFDLEAMQYQTASANDLIIPLGSGPFAGGAVSLQLEDAENKVLMAAICVFFASGNGQEGYSIPQDRKYTAGKILDAVYVTGGAIKVFRPENSTAAWAPVKTIETGAVAWQINSGPGGT